LWRVWSYNFFLKFSRLIFKIHFRYFELKTLFQALYLEIKPLKSTLAGKNPKIAITQKALHRIL
jgi:hypothetical protein